MSFISKVAIQSACVALSSRLVGAGFRIAETHHEGLQESNIFNDPGTVTRREVATLSLAWVIALLTSAAVIPAAKRRNISLNLVMGGTAILGTLIAESLARVYAYSHVAHKILPAGKFPILPVVATPSTSNGNNRPLPTAFPSSSLSHSQQTRPLIPQYTPSKAITFKYHPNTFQHNIAAHQHLIQPALQPNQSQLVQPLV